MTEPILILALLHFSGDSLLSRRTRCMVFEFEFKLKKIPLACHSSPGAFISLLALSFFFFMIQEVSASFITVKRALIYEGERLWLFFNVQNRSI